MMRLKLMRGAVVLSLLAVMGSAVVNAQQSAETLTVYSGRSEDLIAPILEQFSQVTGVQVDVRYGSTSEMAATILEEGQNSPADVFIAQDAGALGALSTAGQLRVLSPDVLERVNAEFASDDGQWVGLSGRARVLVYNTERVSEDALPGSILELAEPEWVDRVGWAPTNGSFQAHVTALRLLVGEAETRTWLEGLIGNNAIAYDNNRAVVQAVIDGEVEIGLVNHYYLLGFLAENPDVPAANYFFPGGDPGSLINVAGAGVVTTSDTPALAERLILYLLGTDAQLYFSSQTFEYPLAAGVAANAALPAIESIENPALDLSDLSDLQTTLDLLSAVGATP
jgi:iron(III) transport system substrate-binding protein